MRVAFASDPRELERPTFHAAEWRDADAELGRFDARIGGASSSRNATDPTGFEGPETITLQVDHAGAATWPETALEILTRYQCFVRRRNEASSTTLFDYVLAGHRALHDVEKPLVYADLLHALDTHVWMLRLEPNASLAAQLAALFHDVERLASEADVRVEQHAEDYAAFKRAHARGSARMMRELLAGVGIDAEVAGRAEALVERHETPSCDEELALLNDADALSFFSRNSDGFLRYYGLAHTRKKVAFTLDRMRPRARVRLAHVRLHPEVRRLVDERATAASSFATRAEE